jgi:hypothetical protein
MWTLPDLGAGEPMARINVSHLRQDSGEGFADVTASVHIGGVEQAMTFRRRGNHPRLADGKVEFDPFSVALLIPAMLRGAELVIDGSVDESLLLALRTSVQATLRTLAPEWRQIAIHAEPRVSTRGPDYTLGAAMGMSGGVDSLHLVRHHLLDPAVPEHLRIKLFLHNHVGAHGDSDSIFEEQFNHVRQYADRVGVPLVSVACRMGALYREMPFIHSHTMRNVAAAMTSDHLFTRFLYASSQELGHSPKRSRFSGISALEPSLLPQFDTRDVFWSSFGGHATRLQKTQEVLSDSRLRENLLVCIRGFRGDRRSINCGRCYKCARALFHAHVSGVLSDLAGTFDLDAFWAGHNRSVLRLLRHSLGPRQVTSDIDLLKYLIAAGYPFPPWSRPALAVFKLTHGTRHSLLEQRPT